MDEKERSKGEILSGLLRMPDPPVRGSPSIDPLSPTVQYERAMEALLGGGHLRFQQNWRDLQAFQLTFLAWFKQKDAEDPESPHWYNPYEDVSTAESRLI